MRNLLKIAAVLVLSFAAYYLVMGGSMLMSQGQLSQAMVDFSKEEESKLLEAGEEIEDGAEGLDVASASHAVLVMALTMLAVGLVEGLAGLFGLLGGKRRRLLIVSIVFAVMMLASSITTLISSGLNIIYVLEVLAPILLIVGDIGVFRMEGREQLPTLPR